MADSNNRLPLTAAILAGGRSQRMGVDKTLLEIDGVPMLARVAQAMGGVAEHVMVVTTRPDAANSAGLAADVRIVTDNPAYHGPLGAIATALEAAESGWVLVVAADMPWISPDVVHALWTRKEAADVVVPRNEGGVEPLLALYRVEAALPAAREALADGEKRPISLYQKLTVVEVPESEFREVDPQMRSLVNINTPHDLELGAPEYAADKADAVRLHVIEVGTRRKRGMPVERAITVYLNGIEIMTVQATPDDLREFAVGFLFVEGFITERESLGEIEVDSRRGMVFVNTAEELPEGMKTRKRFLTSGCGRGVTFTSAGKAIDVDPIESDLVIDAENVYEMMGQMSRAAYMYRDTGGMHACAVGTGGKVSIVREDVGRHNALDKTLGAAWLEDQPFNRSVLLTSGRISSEMAIKAARTGIPIVVSRTAVTDLAAEVATALGLTLVGYARGGKLVVYTHPERVREGGAA